MGKDVNDPQRSRLEALGGWIRKPESWLSIAAAVLSAITFYLVYAKPGELQVFMAEEVGLNLRPADSTLALVLPVTLVNTGATTRSRVVEGISSLFVRHGVATDTLPYVGRWGVEFTYVGKEQYFQKYPKKVKSTVAPSVVDFLDYNGRAVPFTIGGGSSISKILGLLQVDERRFAGPVRAITIKLRIRTPHYVYTSEAVFDCEGITVEPTVTRYCHRLIGP